MSDVISHTGAGGVGYRKAASSVDVVWFFKGIPVIPALRSEVRQVDVRASLHEVLVFCEGERIEQQDLQSVRHYKLAHVVHHRLTLPGAQLCSRIELCDCCGLARGLTRGGLGYCDDGDGVEMAAVGGELPQRLIQEVIEACEGGNEGKSAWTP